MLRLSDLPSTVRLVLFDLGGVVCHFDPVSRLRALAALAPHGALTPETVHARLWESGFSERADRGAYTDAEMIAFIKPALGIQAGAAAIRAAWVTAFAPDPAVLTLIDTLRQRVRVGLLTDNPPLLRIALDARYPDLLARFDPALFSHEFGALKPAPALFRAVRARVGLAAEAVLLVDDNAGNVAGARAAGMRAILYPSAGLRDAEHDAYLN